MNGVPGGLQDMLGLTENDGGGGLDREHLNPVIMEPLQWAGPWRSSHLPRSESSSGSSRRVRSDPEATC